MINWRPKLPQLQPQPPPSVVPPAQPVGIPGQPVVPQYLQYKHWYKVWHQCQHCVGRTDWDAEAYLLRKMIWWTDTHFQKVSMSKHSVWLWLVMLDCGMNHPDHYEWFASTAQAAIFQNTQYKRKPVAYLKVILFWLQLRNNRYLFHMCQTGGCTLWIWWTSGSWSV